MTSGPVTEDFSNGWG